MFGSLGSLLGGNYHDGSLLSNQNGGQIGNQQFNNQSGLLNGYNPQQAQARLQQLYNQQYNPPKPKWVIDGKEFTSVRDVANELYPTDCPEKTHFILKYE